MATTTTTIVTTTESPFTRLATGEDRPTASFSSFSLWAPHWFVSFLPRLVSGNRKTTATAIAARHGTPRNSTITTVCQSLVVFFARNAFVDFRIAMLRFVFHFFHSPYRSKCTCSDVDHTIPMKISPYPCEIVLLVVFPRTLSR